MQLGEWARMDLCKLIQKQETFGRLQLSAPSVSSGLDSFLGEMDDFFHPTKSK